MKSIDKCHIIGIDIGGSKINDSAEEVGHIIIDDKKDLEFLTVKQIRKYQFSKIAIKEFENNLAIGFANIINILDPEAIIIGGGAVNNVRFLLPIIKKIAGKFIVSPKSIKSDKMIMGKLGEDAGAIDAASLLYES